MDFSVKKFKIFHELTSISSDIESDLEDLWMSEYFNKRLGDTGGGDVKQQYNTIPVHLEQANFMMQHSVAVVLQPPLRVEAPNREVVGGQSEDFLG